MTRRWFRRIPYVYALEQRARNHLTKRRLRAELAAIPKEGHGSPQEAQRALGRHRLRAVS